ncbi:metallopeptidase TldD-related protein [Amycolatopsis sp. NPDC049691]|uniref:metallopeptidase TldD-related protein n=1 Tax=Amycolatopsis sp. NPDC049691 TaxID=3155155 RepID=UPI00341442A1
MPASPQDTVELALAAGPRGGDLVAIAEEHSAANLRWAGNTLTTNGVTTSRGLKVIALDRRPDGTCGVGTVTRSDVHPAEVGDVVREAVKTASAAPAAEDAGELPAGPAPASWDDPPAGTEVGVLRRFAAELGATLSAAAAAGRTLYGFAEHQVTSTFLGTSAGLRVRHDQPTGRLELNAKSPDLTRSAWAGATTRDFSDVDIASLDASLARRLSWQSRQLELPAGRYETVLPPTAVADLMVHLYWSAGLRAAAEGRTVFGRPGGGTRIGERLAALPITLFSDPGHPGLECRPFVVGHGSEPDSSVFDNGLPAGRVPWISAGVLSALRSSRYSAALAGLPVTPAVDNLVLTGDGDSPPSLDAMIAATKRGLLLTCLWYIRKVDPRTLLLTGLTRDGVYLVENGEVAGAVNNFRFNESPVGMLDRLLEVGATEDRTLPREWSDDFTRCAMPPLRVGGFTMSSVSRAK